MSVVRVNKDIFDGMKEALELALDGLQVHASPKKAVDNEGNPIKIQEFWTKDGFGTNAREYIKVIKKLAPGIKDYTPVPEFQESPSERFNEK